MVRDAEEGVTDHCAMGVMLQQCLSVVAAEKVDGSFCAELHPYSRTHAHEQTVIDRADRAERSFLSAMHGWPAAAAAAAACYTPTLRRISDTFPTAAMCLSVGSSEGPVKQKLLQTLLLVVCAHTHARTHAQAASGPW